MELIKKLKLCTVNSNATVTLLDFDVNSYKIDDGELYIIVDGDSNVSVKKITADEFIKIKNKINGVGENQIELNLGEQNV